jgi:hypothetical protein
VVRPTLTGSPWLRGFKFGAIALAFAVIDALGYHGVFNLPGRIWVWWMIGAAITYAIAGPVLGWIAERVAPARPAGG